MSGSKTATGGASPATVRALTDADRQAWLSMRQALWMGSDATTAAAANGELLRDPKKFGALAYAVFIAETDGRAIGFVEVSLRDDLREVPGRAGYIEGVYVGRAHTRAGTGRALIAAAEGWTRMQGATTLAAETFADNQESVAFHEAVGFARTAERTTRGRHELVLAKTLL